MQENCGNKPLENRGETPGFRLLLSSFVRRSYSRDRPIRFDLTKSVRRTGTANHFVAASSRCFSGDNYRQKGRKRQGKKPAFGKSVGGQERRSRRCEGYEECEEGPCQWTDGRGRRTAGGWQGEILNRLTVGETAD
jgi:hypothetical protein